jgi:hypothetical protein
LIGRVTIRLRRIKTLPHKNVPESVLIDVCSTFAFPGVPVPESNAVNWRHQK